LKLFFYTRVNGFLYQKKTQKFLEELEFLIGIEKSSHSPSKWCMFQKASELPRGKCAGAQGVPLNVQRYAAELRATHEFFVARTRAHISHRLEPEPGTLCPGAGSRWRPLSER